jgi:hypothetical protein
MNEFIAAQRAAQDQGETLLTNDDGSPFDPSNPDKGEFFQAQERPKFFKTEDISGRPSKAAVADQAYSIALATDGTEDYDAIKSNVEAGTIEIPALEALQNALDRQGLTLSKRLELDFYTAQSPEDQMKIANEEMQRLNIKRLPSYQYALIAALAVGAGDMPFIEWQSAVDKFNFADVEDRKQWLNRMNRRQARIDINAGAAQINLTTAGGIVDVAWGEMLPIVPWLNRLRIQKAIGETAGIDTGTWWLGSDREILRQELSNFSAEEWNQFGEDFLRFIEEKMSTDQGAFWINKFQLLETMQTVFTDEVFDGDSARDSTDIWLGNFETVLEAAIGVAFLYKGATTVVGAATKVNGITARNASRAANRRAGAAMDEAFQQDDLAVELTLLPDEAAPQVLPRPPRMTDNIEDLPDGTKAVATRSERVASEVLESSATPTMALTPLDKTNAINQSLTDMDLIDHPHVQGKMNTLAMFDDDSGYRMRVVVGETAEGGYRNIQDAMDEVAELDPNFEKLRLMRINGDGVLEDVFETPRDFARALVKGEVDSSTAGRIGGGDGAVDDSFYLVYDTEHFWHTIDKNAFGPEAFQSGGIVPRLLLSPNAKFGDEIYGSALRAYMGEQTFLKNFDILFEPFYRMNKEDKRFVAGAYEWMEDFGKNNGRAPDINEIRSHYDGITETQLNGMVALQTGMDTMYQLFNRKLYREWQGVGFKTARPVVDGMPLYHGRMLDDAEITGKALDPVTGKMVTVKRRDLEVLKRDGGGVMELDVPVEVAGDVRDRATRILIRGEDYKVGELSTRPLKYHPGYSMRFYDDPYFIVKVTDDVHLNGKRVQGERASIPEAVRTAGTEAEAARWAARANRATEERGHQGVRFEIKRANDLSNTEGALFHKTVMQREGRLFWDDRNFDRLPDVNGNRATLEDPVKSLERGIGMAARQLTHEDLLRTYKRAWSNDYGELLGDDKLLNTFDLKEISQRLRQLRQNTPGDVKRIREAKEMIDYMRLLQGSESNVIPALREAALNVAISVNRWTDPATTSGKVLQVGTLGTSRLVRGKRIEQLAMTMDPFRAMRSVAFNAFMVFRPVRQALLQSAQIGYLAALDPLYAASPRLFTDAFALRRGLAALRKGGYEDGFSVKGMAKTMGISEKEYRVLLREFDRSGLIDLVDVHSFSGGAGRFRKTALPAKDSPLGTVGYKARQASRGVRDWFQNIGFNFGERNNLTFTYNLGLRRVMKRKGYESLLEMKKGDWNELRTEASNLALGMVKPNNFAYQTGAWGVATQFFSFSHKAMLGMLGANPALKGTDALRIALGTYLLYGANMFGARDFVEDQLTNIGVPDQPIPGTTLSLVDLLSAGGIDSVFNQMGRWTVEDWEDIETAPFAPGFDFPRMWDMQLRNVWEQPTKVAFGPFGNIASNTLQSMDIIHWIHNGNPDLHPADKFMQSAVVLSAAILPAANDALKTYMGYKMGLWYSQSNEALALETTLNGLIARGVFGARTRSELAYYNLQSTFWEDQSNYNDAVQTVRKAIKQQISLFYDGKLSVERLQSTLGGLTNLFEDMPEGVRLQFMTDVMDGVVRDGQNDRIVEQSIFGLIVDKALVNERFSSFDEVLGLIDRLNQPADKTKQLKQLAEETFQSRKNVDDRALEELENGN